jgi:hypothetical protein
MSITNGYTTLAAFQAYANMSTITADETTTIEQAIEAASRTIDRIANRRFYMDANATARLYRTTSFYTLWYLGTPPDDVVEACLILSADYVKRASSVGGVLGLSELGAIRMSPLGRDISAIVPGVPSRGHRRTNPTHGNCYIPRSRRSLHR